MEGNDELDLILDRALSGYCEVEPRPGIEGRVLHRVRAARHRMRWLWLVPVPLALAVLIAFEFRPIEPPSPVRIAAIGHTPSWFTPVEVHRVSVRRQHRKPIVPMVVSLPKKEVFPTPAPLTPEEEALVSLSTAQSIEAKIVAEQPEIEAIQIPELRIHPLTNRGE